MASSDEKKLDLKLQMIKALAKKIRSAALRFPAGVLEPLSNQRIIIN